MEQGKSKTVTMRPPDVSKKFTTFSNDVIDHIMPRVSPHAWKVLTVIVRQTVVWVEDRHTMKRKDWDEISYSQFTERTGVGQRRVRFNGRSSPVLLYPW